MANLAKLEFAALELSGDNYLSWVLDAKIHLRANGLGKAIEDGSDASPKENAKAMIFLRRHIHEALKSEYVVVDEPLVLWKALCERYNHQKTVTLPRARYEWTHLRFQDFKTVKYLELVSCLLLAEQRAFIEKSPISPNRPLPEIHAASREVNATSSRGSIRKRGRGGKRGRWQGSRKDCGAHPYGLGPRNNPSMNGKNAPRNKGKTQASYVPRNNESACYRCGAKRHWMRTCRTPKHLADLYQTSLKNKKVETNYVAPDPPAIDGSSEISRRLDKTHLDVSDFVTERGNEIYGSELD
ncbi:uncharacterized protein LOC110773578 [Prunus avium]|uniref:Uncharacterized protein LOC110773578 n=1 Tax=Prunus avium TaxID=42229 RepID=A0A6P5U396_PRUAV|nr:uncharacterized protein LOC110773578 [Prunus avium]